MYQLQYGQTTTSLLDGAITKLGRATGNEVICDDPSASRFHAELKVENGQLTFRDKDSTNGTQLNGNPVRGFSWHILSHGDVLKIGEWEATVQKSDEAETLTDDNEIKVQRPMVDPSGPQEALEVTRAHKIRQPPH